jgi:hypothetical protein
MKKIIFLLVVVGFYSCNSPLDKSIFEPLTVEELKKSIEKDSLFSDTYEYIVYIRDTVLKSDLDKVKFADLTYERINDFFKFSSDTTYFKPINERLEKEWNKKHNIYKQKADSILNYWKKYEKENSINQYVSIELIEVDKKYYTNSNVIKHINLGFKITPLKGKLDYISFGYGFRAKDDEEVVFPYGPNRMPSIYSISYVTNLSSKPNIQYEKIDSEMEEFLRFKNLKTLSRDYNLYIEAFEIGIDGRDLNWEDLNIPKEVSNYWEYENDELFKDFYLKSMLKTVLNVEYITEHEYYHRGINEILKIKDPLVFEFIILPTEME